MTKRSDRLRHLLEVQQQLKAMHEMRRAGHLADARAAEADIADVLARRTGNEPLADLFPDVYARFVDRAWQRRAESEAQATVEADKIATETVRGNTVERQFREALRDEDRASEERATLDAVERLLSRQ